MLSRKAYFLILGPLAFLLIMVTGPYGDMSPQANAVLASTAWVAIWWITEVIPLAVTSLLPIALFPLSGGLNIGATTAAYGHRMVFLYLGGFIVAIAIERWNLHQRIALSTIQFMGIQLNRIVLGFMLATAGLSMWISNTATTVMMLPIGMAVVHQLHEDDEALSTQFGKLLMLAIAYSASIGGFATLIGTPPNLVLAGVVQEFYGIEIQFLDWMLFAFPISMSLLFICWIYLTKKAFPIQNRQFPKGAAAIDDQLHALGKISYEEKMVLAVFGLMAFCWISRSFLLSKILPGIDDSIIAIMGAILIFILPDKSGKAGGLLKWEDAVKLPWGIILLFGGGLAIAEGFKSSGLATWIGSQTLLFQGIPLFLLIALIVAMVNFLTEITSNLATTSMILPILTSVAAAIGVHPYGLLIGATLAASCAFMLPVATPPNAIVFGSGYLHMQDIVRTGFWLNLLSIILISLLTYFLLPVIWGIDLAVFPIEFNTGPAD